VIENQDQELTSGIQHAGNIVHCGEPQIASIRRERREAHPGTEPFGNPGNVKLGILSDRKP
jgi:hypothetical protein